MLIYHISEDAGALAHISWPRAANFQMDGSHSLRALNHTARIRDAMTNVFSTDPRHLEVLLWRGRGFSTDSRQAEVSADVLNNLSWNHFGNMFDYTDHGGHFPYSDRTAITYDPIMTQVWFHN